MGVFRSTTLLLLSAALPFALLLTGCESSRAAHNRPPQNIRPEPWGDASLTSTAQSKDGQTLRMYFDNANGTATLLLDGQTIELKSQRPASGIWYANDQYELKGKGESLELKKDGTLIFKSDVKDSPEANPRTTATGI